PDPKTQAGHARPLQLPLQLSEQRLIRRRRQTITYGNQLGVAFDDSPHHFPNGHSRSERDGLVSLFIGEAQEIHHPGHVHALAQGGANDQLLTLVGAFHAVASFTSDGLRFFILPNRPADCKAPAAPDSVKPTGVGSTSRPSPVRPSSPVPRDGSRCGAAVKGRLRPSPLDGVPPHRLLDA